jgi:hypothetical protein
MKKWQIRGVRLALLLLTLLSCTTPPKRPDPPVTQPRAGGRMVQTPASGHVLAEPARNAPPHLTIAKGGRVFPHDFLWTGKEYALAYIRAKSSVDSTVYLARIDPDGRVLSDVRIGEGLTPRLAFSGGGFGIAYDSFRNESWDIYFSKADAAGAPLEGSEVKLGPGSYPLIAWNPSSETWGVFWRNFEASGVAKFTLARLSSSGRGEAATNVANLDHPAEGFGETLGLWPKDRGFSSLFAPPTRAMAIDQAGVVHELPLPKVFGSLKGPSLGGLRVFFEEDHQLRAIYQEEGMLWLSDGAKMRPLLQVPPETFVQDPAVVQHRGRSHLVWSEHTGGIPNNRLFSCVLSRDGCEGRTRLDPDELPQQFVFVAQGPRQLAVLYQAGDYNGAPELRLVFLP